jgi:hypothetical protein
MSKCRSERRQYGPAKPLFLMLQEKIESGEHEKAVNQITNTSGIEAAQRYDTVIKNIIERKDLSY